MKFMNLVISAGMVLVMNVQADIIDNLGAGQWAEIPNSSLAGVKPSGWSANVIAPWCGGAMDTKRSRLIVWGGGHSDYAGNELYVFDLNTLRWQRLTDPAPITTPNISTGEYPLWNGKIQPLSRHTYEYVEYLHSMDRFMSFGFASPYPDGGKGGNRCHSFNFETNLWERRMPTPGWGLNALSSYDPVTGHGWVKGVDSDSYLAEFMPDSGAYGTWVRRSNNATDWMYKYSLTMDIDPQNRKLFATGGGESYVWDISNPDAGVTRTAISTSGGSTVTGKNCPGLAYDPVSEKIIGWAGGRTVYSLDLAARAWTSHAGSGADPGSPATHGTYGRFRYCPKRNVFAVVNSINSNVFVYRHTAGSSAPQSYLDLLESTTRAQKPVVACAKDMTLTAEPNPFYTRTDISIKGKFQVTSCMLTIFNINGKQLVTFNLKLETSKHVTWNASGLPSGVYLLRARIHEKTVSKRLFLM